MKLAFEPRRAAWWDGVLLAFLVIATCSQLNLGDIGQDTTKEGYVTKQLKIALPDIALLLNFGWFLARTAVLRGWKRLWWPPLPCWALLFAMSLSLAHSSSIWEKSAQAISSAREELAEDASAFDRRTEFKLALADKGFKQGLKEAVAETIQFGLYFLVAPLLFVNLMRDRRALDASNGAASTCIDRTRLALSAFGIGATFTVMWALWHLSQGTIEAPRAGFGSPNAYAAWLAISLPLLVVWLQSDERLGRARRLALPLAAIGLLSVMSLWAHAALVLGLVLACALGRGAQTVRLGVTTLLIATFCGVLWLQTPRDARRETFLRLDNPMAETDAGKRVKKQFIEWGAATAWAVPRTQRRAFATGVGPGNYQSNIGTFYSDLPNEDKMPADSNNLYLVQGVSLGILGLGALLWTWGHFTQLAWRACKYLQTDTNIKSADWLALGVLASLFSWALVNVFHASIVRGTGVVLAFLFALAVVCARKPEDEISNFEVNAAPSPVV